MRPDDAHAIHVRRSLFLVCASAPGNDRHIRRRKFERGELPRMWRTPAGGAVMRRFACLRKLLHWNPALSQDRIGDCGRRPRDRAVRTSFQVAQGDHDRHRKARRSVRRIHCARRRRGNTVASGGLGVARCPDSGQRPQLVRHWCGSKFQVLSRTSPLRLVSSSLTGLRCPRGLSTSVNFFFPKTRPGERS